MVGEAVRNAEHGVNYADRSVDALRRVSERAAHADALHQAGRIAEAETRFREAELMQKEWQPAYPLLYSLRGFGYCDLLLTIPERAVWQLKPQQPDQSGDKFLHFGVLRAVSTRAAQTLKWAEVAQGITSHNCPRSAHAVSCCAL